MYKLDKKEMYRKIEIIRDAIRLNLQTNFETNSEILSNINLLAYSISKLIDSETSSE